MQCRLCSEDDDIKLYKWIQGQLKDTQKRLAEGRAVLLHLQNQLMHVACDDPGAAIGAQLALPILQVGCACFDDLWRQGLPASICAAIGLCGCAGTPRRWLLAHTVRSHAEGQTLPGSN